MSRQREFQLKWECLGKCGNCREHPPIYKAKRCKACYCAIAGGRLPKPQQFGCIIKRTIHNLGSAIATHKKWIRNYKARNAVLIAKHLKWIARYRTQIEELKTATPKRQARA